MVAIAYFDFGFAKQSFFWIATFDLIAVGG
jgi:hypothetical protein